MSRSKPVPPPLPRHLRLRLFRTRLSSSIQRNPPNAEQQPDAPRYYVHAQGPHKHEDVKDEALQRITEILGFDYRETICYRLDGEVQVTQS